MVNENPLAKETPPTMTARRYPGVQPFGDNEIQRELFRGRDEEKYELLQLVLAERLVLLFARSGIGKSSLISAGLLEPLRDRGYFPMVVRVSGSSDGPLESLYEGIRAFTVFFKKAADADIKVRLTDRRSAAKHLASPGWARFKV